MRIYLVAELLSHVLSKFSESFTPHRSLYESWLVLLPIISKRIHLTRIKVLQMG
jgi:hypothetical protein